MVGNGKPNFTSRYFTSTNSHVSRLPLKTCHYHIASLKNSNLRCTLKERHSQRHNGRPAKLKLHQQKTRVVTIKENYGT
jgi:hypothetical protein